MPDIEKLLHSWLLKGCFSVCNTFECLAQISTDLYLKSNNKALNAVLDSEIPEE
jgi:hypothetical protein